MRVTKKEHAYQLIVDGIGFCVRSRSRWRLACCDCGLVHNVALVIGRGGWIGMAMERNARATVGRRKTLTAQRKK